MSDTASLFEEELEALQAIYMDDLIVTSDTLLQITLHPNTADNDEKKFVCLTLICNVPLQYPEKEPKFMIKNPRGISDAHIESIKENLVALSHQKIGEVMLFDLLEYAKDSLTDNNHPSCVCPICLEHFKENEDFFRTECYHYYHFSCIKGYICGNQDTYVCPVCRFSISNEDVIQIKNYNEAESTSGDSNEFQVNPYVTTKQYRDWLKRCQTLFEKQRVKGGIIDLEYEKNKYLISADTDFAVTLVDANETNDEIAPSSSNVKDKNTGKDEYKENKQFKKNEDDKNEECPMSSQKRKAKSRKPHLSKSSQHDTDQRSRQPPEKSKLPKSRKEEHRNSDKPGPKNEDKQKDSVTGKLGPNHDGTKQHRNTFRDKSKSSDDGKKELGTAPMNDGRSKHKKRPPNRPGESCIEEQKTGLSQAGKNKDRQHFPNKSSPGIPSKERHDPEPSHTGKSSKNRHRPPDRPGSSEKLDQKKIESEGQPKPYHKKKEKQYDKNSEIRDNKGKDQKTEFRNIGSRENDVSAKSSNDTIAKNPLPHSKSAVTPATDVSVTSKKTVRPPPGFKPL